ncbi:MAG TPA: putative maltokinase [Roseiflexaceae bacterium]|nr:putative maltokinase [Roseiflexaceae bacterium]
MTDSLVTITITDSWNELLQSPGRAALEAALPAYIQPRRWFGGKARGIASARIVDTIPISYAGAQASIAMVRVSYQEGEPDIYVLPLTFAPGDRAGQLVHELPHAVVARVAGPGAISGVLYDALLDRGLCAALLELIADSAQLAGQIGAIQASATSAFGRLRGADPARLEPKIVTAEQSNSSIIYGDRLIMKLFRRLEPGLNPDLEIGRFLTERSTFRHVPPAAGALEYRRPAGEPGSLAILQGFVPNQGDAWGFTLRTIAASFDAVAADSSKRVPGSASTPVGSPLARAAQALPSDLRPFIGDYLASAELLGQRTAEMHLALSGDDADPAFAPEPFGERYRRSVIYSMRERATRSFQMLRAKLADLSEPLRASALRILEAEQQILSRIQLPFEQAIDAMRTRIHGDYHLGQVLYTGADFMIIDFEGEPARPLSERRIKSSPLQDVAGMLRSFHYAPYAVLMNAAAARPNRPAPEWDVANLEPWARVWHYWVSAAFLKSYLAAAGQASFLPASRIELEQLLDAFLLDKALYELNYELNNRPDWLPIPIEGILQLIAA